MMRFIYLCMAVIAFSFVAIPAYNSIAEKRADIGSRDAVIAQEETNQSLSFDEIYEIANEGTTNANIDQDMATIAQSLNEIVPAAGAESTVPALPEDFSAEFQPTEHPAF